MSKKFPKTHCAEWAVDANGLPYPKKAIGKGENLAQADQSFKESSDINNIIQKAQRTGVLSHVNKNAQFYEDLTDFDYEGSKNKIAEANSAFYDLDADIRAEFNNNPGQFLKVVGPMKKHEIIQKFPEWAEPERQLPVPGQLTTQPAPPADPAPPPTAGGGGPTDPVDPDPSP